MYHSSRCYRSCDWLEVRRGPWRRPVGTLACGCIPPFCQSDPASLLSSITCAPIHLSHNDRGENEGILTLSLSTALSLSLILISPFSQSLFSPLISFSVSFSSYLLFSHIYLSSSLFVLHSFSPSFPPFHLSLYPFFFFFILPTSLPLSLPVSLSLCFPLPWLPAVVRVNWRRADGLGRREGRRGEADKLPPSRRGDAIAP